MNNQPKSICILRLSALGDVSHMIPVARTIQKYWPDTKLTWIIGKNEVRLANVLPNIEFIEFDKSNIFGSIKNLIQKFKNRKFDVLLCAQVAFRANLISALVPATIKLGYDNIRSKELHSFFTNQQIKYKSGQHVLDSFFSFIEHFGLNYREMNWGYEISEESRQFANQQLIDDKLKIIISPCSSNSLRNWLPNRYAKVADYAAQELNAQIILCGGPSKKEKQFGTEIENLMQYKPLNLIGKDTLNKFLALLQKSDVLISPDSGPAHLATGVGTPVIGLYAASDSNRSGPYLSRELCVDKYKEAAKKYMHKSANELKWGKYIHRPGVMTLIQIDDVILKLNQVAQKLTTSK